MTDKQFHQLLVDPQTGPKLDAWRAEDARTDADRAERAQRQRNEEIVIRYLRSQWQAEGQR